MSKESSFVELTDTNFQEKVVESKERILVVLGADWCGSCHIMRRTLKELAAKSRGHFKIGWLDIDTNKQISKEYEVQELPIMLFFQNGLIRDHIIGMVPRQELKSKLETVFK